MAGGVSIEREGHVAEVILDRPAKHNALDMDMFSGLADAAAALRADASVRAVVLRGAGDNFCAGIDTSMFSGGAGLDPALMAPQPGSAANLFQLAAVGWRELPVPVIAALHGIAWGAGLQVALGADLRYAHPATRLSVMEIRWGLVPDMGLTVTARGLVRADVLRELSLSGRIVEAREAERLGLVTALQEDPVDAARHMAAAIAAGSPDAVRGIKRLLTEGLDSAPEQALRLEAVIQSGLLGSANQTEAVRANIEKREPAFRDYEPGGQ